MGKYDQFLVGLSSSTPSGGSYTPPVVQRKHGKYDQFLEGLDAPREDSPVEEKTSFQKYGKALPIAGSIIGGIAAAPTIPVTGPAGPIGGAALGGAAGESARQILGSILGEDSPQTSIEAAREIGLEGAKSAVGEVIGAGIGRVAGKAYKAFPKIAQSISGTPATNIARAQQRGLKVFAPGVSREAAGKAQELVETPIIKKLFSPKEQVLLKAKDAGFADDLMKSVMLKQIKGVPISAKEAIGLRILAPVKRAADTLRGVGKNIELDKATTGARAVIAERFPELAKRLGDTEKAITASQLRVPLPVKRTNPNQISGLATLIGSGFGFINPKLLVGLGLASPLSMALMGATSGQVKKSIPKLARRAIQRGGAQVLSRVLSEE